MGERTDVGASMQLTYRWDYPAVVEQWYEPLFLFACRLSEPTLAADLTQETFQVFLEKSDDIRDPKKVKGWLFTTLYRQFLSIHNRAKKWPKADCDLIDLLPDEGPAEPGNCVDCATLLRALSELDEKYRGPIVLFYLKDYSYKEISVALDIKIGTVMSRLSRGKSALKKMLETSS